MHHKHSGLTTSAALTWHGHLARDLSLIVVFKFVRELGLPYS